MPAIDFSIRGKPEDFGGSHTRPPRARGDGVTNRIPGVTSTYGRRLLSFKRATSSAGSVYLFRTSETKSRQFVNPDATLLGDTGCLCKQRFEGPTTGRVVEVRAGTAQRCGDPPSKKNGGNAVSLSCCLECVPYR
jgi:hypothetical protein